MKTTFLIFISSLIRAYEYPRIPEFTHTTEFKDVEDADGKPLGERYVYMGRALTLDEFNAAAARVFAENFPGEGRTFRPFVLDPEAEAKRAEAKAVAAAEAEAAQLAAAEAAEAEQARIAAEQSAAADDARIAAEQEAADREAARQSRLAVEAHTRKLDAETAAKAKADAAGTPAVPVARPGPVAPPVNPPAPPVAPPEAEKPPVLDPATTGETKTEEKTEETPESPAPFTLVETNIMQGEERIGSLHPNGPRLLTKFKPLEPQVKAWLATLNP